VEVLLEAIAENRAALKPVEQMDPRQKAWDEAIARVQAYLAVWRIGDIERTRNCAHEIVNSAKRGSVAAGREIEAALEKADDFLKQIFAADGENFDELLQSLLLGSGTDQKFDQEHIKAALREGMLNVARAKIPVRPPETRPMTMQTSLSRLPSIRLIGGWIFLVVLLFVLFILTHR
jgi:hypothetical protein